MHFQNKPKEVSSRILLLLYSILFCLIVAFFSSISYSIWAVTLFISGNNGKKFSYLIEQQWYLLKDNKNYGSTNEIIYIYRITKCDTEKIQSFILNEIKAR